MAFKDNLLKKIEIDRLVRQIGMTLGPADSERRIDKSLMRQLLALSPLKPERVRDLEVFIGEADGSNPRLILVLDNDLAFYNTTLSDVAMRKSPTVKEMVSFRNAFKILNDKDVVVCKKGDSLARVQQMCLKTLDLSYGREDIAAIATDGRVAFEVVDPEGVIQCLTLLAELTGFVIPPPAFKIDHHSVIAKTEVTLSGEVVCNPTVFYGDVENALRLIEKPIGSRDRAALAWMRDVAKGTEKADKEGLAVIGVLEELAIQKMPIF
jgi:hypothetical protein